MDPDPVQSRLKTMEFHADLWLPVQASAFAQAVYEAATGMLSKSDIDRIADRRARLDVRKREIEQAEEAKALALAARTPIHPRWVAHEVGSVLEPDAIMLDDSVSAAAFVRAYHRRDEPGTYFKSGGSAGGWGTGAAFGAKMSRPDQDIVLVSGDGYFMFGSPLAPLWAASHYKAPFLSVVFVNRSYSTGTSGLERQYPEGAAVSAGNFEGGVFDPPPNFAKLAEAANCYGESVSESQQVGPALRRGMEHVRNGVPAVVAVTLPTIPEEMTRQG